MILDLSDITAHAGCLRCRLGRSVKFHAWETQHNKPSRLATYTSGTRVQSTDVISMCVTLRHVQIQFKLPI